VLTLNISVVTVSYVPDGTVPIQIVFQLLLFTIAVIKYFILIAQATTAVCKRSKSLEPKSGRYTLCNGQYLAQNSPKIVENVFKTLITVKINNKTHYFNILNSSHFHVKPGQTQ
jgi:hypothetical protein